MSKKRSGVDIIALDAKTICTTSVQKTIRIPKFWMFLLIGRTDCLPFVLQSPY